MEWAFDRKSEEDIRRNLKKVGLTENFIIITYTVIRN